MNSVATQTPGAGHALCCPNCTFMTLQPGALRAHLAASGHAKTATLLRCRHCGGVSTEKDLLRDHLSLYHGLDTEKLDSDKLEQHWTLEDLEEAGNKPSPAAAAVTGSRKRKSTVPEKLCTEDSQLSPGEIPKHTQSKAKRELMSTGSKYSPAMKKSSHAVNHMSGTPPPTTMSMNPLQLLTYRQLWEAAAAAANNAATVPSYSPVVMNGLDHGEEKDRVLDLSVKTPPKEATTPTGMNMTMNNGHSALGLNLNSSRQSAVSLQKKAAKEARKAQRQNFTPAQNKLLMNWFLEHREKPYPSTEDTKELSAITSLNYAQIKKWFANKRMRSKTAGARMSSPWDDYKHDESDYNGNLQWKNSIKDETDTSSHSDLAEREHVFSESVM